MKLVWWGVVVVSTNVYILLYICILDSVAILAQALIDESKFLLFYFYSAVARWEYRV